MKDSCITSAIFIYCKQLVLEYREYEMYISVTDIFRVTAFVCTKDGCDTVPVAKDITTQGLISSSLQPRTFL